MPQTEARARRLVVGSGEAFHLTAADSAAPRPATTAQSGCQTRRIPSPATKSQGAVCLTTRTGASIVDILQEYGGSRAAVSRFARRVEARRAGAATGGGRAEVGIARGQVR